LYGIVTSDGACTSLGILGDESTVGEGSVDVEVDSNSRRSSHSIANHPRHQPGACLVLRKGYV
jgi:hypothetical protein